VQPPRQDPLDLATMSSHLSVGFVAKPTNRHARLCGATEKPDSFLVNHRKPYMQGTTSRRQASRCQAFHLRLPEGLLSLATFDDSDATLHRLCVHDFFLLFLPLCGPHLIPSATRSLEPSLLVSPLLGGHTSIDLSRLFFTCTTQIKPQPTHAILGQESVYTTFSITHHTKE
jgi:hypothetical protein